MDVLVISGIAAAGYYIFGQDEDDETVSSETQSPSRESFKAKKSLKESNHSYVSKPQKIEGYCASEKYCNYATLNDVGTYNTPVSNNPIKNNVPFFRGNAPVKPDLKVSHRQLDRFEKRSSFKKKETLNAPPQKQQIFPKDNTYDYGEGIKSAKGSISTKRHDLRLKQTWISKDHCLTESRVLPKTQNRLRSALNKKKIHDMRGYTNPAKGISKQGKLGILTQDRDRTIKRTTKDNFTTTGALIAPANQAKIIMKSRQPLDSADYMGPKGTSVNKYHAHSNFKLDKQAQHTDRFGTKFSNQGNPMNNYVPPKLKQRNLTTSNSNYQAAPSVPTRSNAIRNQTLQNQIKLSPYGEVRNMQSQGKNTQLRLQDQLDTTRKEFFTQNKHQGNFIGYKQSMLNNAHLDTTKKESTLFVKRKQLNSACKPGILYQQDDLLNTRKNILNMQRNKMMSSTQQQSRIHDVNLDTNNRTVLTKKINYKTPALNCHGSQLTLKEVSTTKKELLRQTQNHVLTGATQSYVPSNYKFEQMNDNQAPNYKHVQFGSTKQQQIIPDTPHATKRQTLLYNRQASGHQTYKQSFLQLQNELEATNRDTTNLRKNARTFRHNIQSIHNSNVNETNRSILQYNKYKLGGGKRVGSGITTSNAFAGDMTIRTTRDGILHGRKPTTKKEIMSVSGENVNVNLKEEKSITPNIFINQGNTTSDRFQGWQTRPISMESVNDRTDIVMPQMSYDRPIGKLSEACIKK